MGVEADDSDSDPTQVPLTPAKWQLFEAKVADHQNALDPASVVEHDVRMDGLLSKQPRQVDVLVRGSTGGQTFTIAVECKRYAKRLGIGAVDEFAGKLLDIGVDRGVLYALSGLTRPAIDRAEGSVQPRITLGDLLETDDHVEPDLGWLFVESDTCPNPNCITGEISWRSWTSAGTILRAGACDSCGTWAVECPFCEEIDLLESGACYSCSATISLGWDRKGSDVESIEVELDGDERSFEYTGERATSPGYWRRQV